MTNSMDDTSPTTRHRGTECPSCGTWLDASTPPDGDAQPAVGDATLCLYCGALLIYGDGFALRRPTLAEAEEAEAVPSFVTAQAIVREMIKHRLLTRGKRS